jgi:hypothetical protein
VRQRPGWRWKLIPGRLCQVGVDVHCVRREVPQGTGLKDSGAAVGAGLPAQGARVAQVRARFDVTASLPQERPAAEIQTVSDRELDVGTSPCEVPDRRARVGPSGSAHQAVPVKPTWRKRRRAFLRFVSERPLGRCFAPSVTTGSRHHVPTLVGRLGLKPVRLSASVAQAGPKGRRVRSAVLRRSNASADNVAVIRWSDASF